MGCSVVLQSSLRILFCDDSRFYLYLQDMYIFLQPAHTKACTKEVRIINGRSPWVSPGATKEGLQKRPQEPEEARADAGFLWFFV